MPVASSRILESLVNGGLSDMSLTAISRVHPPVLFSYLSAKLEKASTGFCVSVDMLAGDSRRCQIVSSEILNTCLEDSTMSLVLGRSYSYNVSVSARKDSNQSQLVFQLCSPNV